MNRNDKKAPFYKKWWYYIILAMLLFGNIAILLWGEEETKAHWLTLISGWISFGATISIGVIAFNQAKDYKKQSDTFIQEQNDLAWRQHQYGHLTAVLEQIASLQKESEKFLLINNKELYETVDLDSLKEVFVRYCTRFYHFYINLMSSLELSGLYFEESEKMLALCDEYFDLLKKHTKKEIDSEFVSLATEKTYNICDTIFNIIRDIECCRTMIYRQTIKKAKEKIKELQEKYAKWIEDKIGKQRKKVLQGKPN